MARTVVGEAVVVRQKYYWPDAQLNFWTIIMMVTAGVVLGINAQFMTQQDALGLPSPWYVVILSPFPSSFSGFLFSNVYIPGFSRMA